MFLELPHQDVPILQAHLAFRVNLDPDGAFWFDSLGFVGHHFFAIEVGGVGIPFYADLDAVPVFHIKDFLRFCVLDGISFSWNVGQGGHVTFEATGFSDLDLLLGIA